jgi:curved DNA-binding protein CbpA
VTDRDAYEVLQVHPRAHELVIKAAFRVLAALYHPDRDQSDASTRRMAELNIAYARVRTIDRRQVYDRERERRQVPEPIVTPYQAPGVPHSAADSSGTRVLDFGRYKGWTIPRLAMEDPDYLRWLSRHSSGIRYRREIEVALRETTRGPTVAERTRGRR